MKKIQIIITCALALLFAGCKDYLDMVPEKDIETIESIFEVRSKTLTFYNSCYDAALTELQPGTFNADPAMLGGGEYAASEFLRNSANLGTYVNSMGGYLGNTLGITDGFQNTNDPYGNLWTMSRRVAGSIYASIRYCNIFIENIDNVYDMPDWEKKAWKAEIKCVKAHYYFELMKRYGPIVLVPQNIQTDADIAQMQSPRSPVDECFAEIVRLFDEAIPDLRPRSQMVLSEKASFSLEAALAFKAKVLLYAASPLFNGNEWYAGFKNRDGVQLFNTTYDREKWRLAGEAADEAIRVAEENGLKLYKKSQSGKSRKLNQITDIQNSVYVTTWSEEEYIMATRSSINARFSVILPRFNPRTASAFWENNYGSLSPHIDIVEMFYTENGLPIDKDKTWSYVNRYKMNRESSAEYTDIVDMRGDVLGLHLRREPRFYANIAGDGLFWISARALDPYWSPQVVNPLRGNKLFGTAYDRFNDPANPQNITGYWQKKYLLATDNLKSTPGDGRAFVVMRMADLYLIQAEAWNEYSGPSEKVYNAIDMVRERAGIPPIRQAWSQFSTSPGDILHREGLIEVIRRERMIELVFEGQRAWDIRRWKTAHLYLNEPKLGWNIMGTDQRAFYNNYDGPKVVDAKPKFVSPRDYFMPIKAEEVMISNIVQNPGWGNN